MNSFSIYAVLLIFLLHGCDRGPGFYINVEQGEPADLEQIKMVLVKYNYRIYEENGEFTNRIQLVMVYGAKFSREVLYEHYYQHHGSFGSTSDIFVSSDSSRVFFGYWGYSDARDGLIVASDIKHRTVEEISIRDTINDKGSVAIYEAGGEGSVVWFHVTTRDKEGQGGVFVYYIIEYNWEDEEFRFSDMALVPRPNGNIALDPRAEKLEGSYIYVTGRPFIFNDDEENKKISPQSGGSLFGARLPEPQLEWGYMDYDERFGTVISGGYDQKIYVKFSDENSWHEVGAGQWAQWAMDGLIYYVKREEPWRLLRLDPRSGRTERVFSGYSHGRGSFMWSNLRVSKDGRYVAFGVVYPNSHTKSIMILNVETNQYYFIPIHASRYIFDWVHP